MTIVHETKLAILRSLAEERDNGYQIAKKTGISKGSVYDHLHELEQAGLVELLDEEESGRGKKHTGSRKMESCCLRHWVNHKSNTYNNYC
jgi:DNA-binding transcriptional ArsR family regulator